ncbi:hypothetical protein YC2023_000186 [Brassica napus]|uniref:RRM domain-containing protein n=1 Tax=Brassica campestris TaxID=3711 RepID=M4D5I5_BRACM
MFNENHYWNESEPEATFSEEEGDVNEGGGDFPEPPEEANLFVGNLAYDVDSQALAMLFEQAGTVEIAEVNKSCDFARFLPLLMRLCSLCIALRSCMFCVLQFESTVSQNG